MLEKIYYNGNFRTGKNYEDVFRAIGTKDGVIQGLGTFEELKIRGDHRTEYIDLHGMTVLPGFNDSHLHLLYYAKFENMVDLGPSKSWNEAKSLIQDYINSRNWKPGEWVEGKNWNQENWDVPIFPDRKLLDEITVEMPIVLTRVCTHVVVTNTLGLELAGLLENPVDEPGGKIDREKDGRPNGVLRENAVGLVYRNRRKMRKPEIKELILFAQERMLRDGITSVQSDDFGSLSGVHYKDIMDAYRELIEEHRLHIRVNEQVRFMEKRPLEEFLAEGYKTGFGNENFRIGPLKMFLDGSLGARTAWMSEPYMDEKSTNGISILSEAEFEGLMDLAWSGGMSLAIHCIGDAAICEAYKKISRYQDHQNLRRNGIVHCQITSESMLEEMGRMGLLAYIQPVFTKSDYPIVEARVGKEMSYYSYAWKTMLKKGMRIAGGSDSPVERFNMLENIYCAVTRKDFSGLPEGGWNSHECLSLPEAMDCMTIGGAYASFEEAIKGKIQVGMLADMVVLDQDPFTVHPDALKEIKPMMTIIGGEIRWKTDIDIINI